MSIQTRQEHARASRVAPTLPSNGVLGTLRLLAESDGYGTRSKLMAMLDVGGLGCVREFGI